MTTDPLTDAQIHRALRALDAGDWPDRATMRTALLMAGALRATLAAQAQLRAGLDGLRRAHAPNCGHYPAMDAGCTCGAAAFNAQIDALIGEPPG